MRKYWQLLLCLVLIFSLIGCEQPPEPVTEPVTETTEATEPTTEVTEPVWTGYVSPKETYTYYYSEGRELQWEEDLIYFANSHFSDNILLRNRKFLVNTPMVQSDSRNFYDETLYQAVLEAVNALIPEITNLTDDQVLYRLQMISALFRDVHTTVYEGSNAIYPILFMPIREGEEFVFYAVILPSKNEKLLYTKLTAINDIPVEEVVERLRAYVSYENEYGFYGSLSQGGFSYEFLSRAMALEATGISQPGDEWAKYTLMDDGGNTYDLNMKADENIRYTSMRGTWLSEALPVPYWYGSTENYWYTTDLAASTLYVRIYSFIPEEEESYADFSNQLTIASRNAGPFNKVILDLRGNGGGYQAEGWRAIINTLGRMDPEDFYILVDGGTYSNSMIFAAEVVNQIPDAVFVGTPTGQAPGFFAGVYDEDYILPNSGMEVRIPTAYWQTFEANEENSLIPDIVLWQTIDDYVACRDVVLEYVLNE